MEALDDSVLTEVSCPHYSLPLKKTPQNEPWEESFLEIHKCYPKWSLRFKLNCYRIVLVVCPNPADFNEH